MEEDEYKSTYNELAAVRCVFEKALSNSQGNRQVKCSLSQHFCLADREGYSCKNAQASIQCKIFLEQLRENSRFVLKLHEVNGPLPHNMEIRVQVGGLKGLAKLLDINEHKIKVDEPVTIGNINQIISAVKKQYGAASNLPYNKIIQSVVQFQGRQRRQR
ncbi:hypothetical protein MNBD_GAMMA06-1489 [hydrothermal vent metagenome]|uniref:Uncharacterized protein n=1 Tax=hydrothermal vent metagenome TaxID=652676 RepID=A0A3B0WHN1_9ZZZZ